MTPRRFVRLGQQAIAPPDINHRLGGALLPVLGIDPGINQRQLDVAQAGGAREEVERLKNETDLAIADRGQRRTEEHTHERQ